VSVQIYLFYHAFTSFSQAVKILLRLSKYNSHLESHDQRNRENSIEYHAFKFLISELLSDENPGRAFIGTELARRPVLRVRDVAVAIRVVGVQRAVHQAYGHFH
jgi:hypothetical protein